MLNIQTRCPNCKKAYQVPEDQSGKHARCAKCGTRFTLQVSADETVPLDRKRSHLAAESVLPSRQSALGPTFLDGQSFQPDGLERFKILCELGAGAFGTVYKAHDTQLDRLVALKTPRLGILGSEADRQRFLREARAAGNLRHPNIVPIYDAGKLGDSYFIASGFIDGRTLADQLEEEKKLSQRKAAELIQKIALALHYAARQRDHSSRYEAGQCHARYRRRANGHGFWHGPSRRRRCPEDPRRRAYRHAGLHESRAARRAKSSC